MWDSVTCTFSASSKRREAGRQEMTYAIKRWSFVPARKAEISDSTLCGQMRRPRASAWVSGVKILRFSAPPWVAGGPDPVGQAVRRAYARGHQSSCRRGDAGTPPGAAPACQVSRSSPPRRVVCCRRLLRKTAICVLVKLCACVRGEPLGLQLVSSGKVGDGQTRLVCGDELKNEVMRGVCMAKGCTWQTGGARSQGDSLGCEGA